MIGKKNSKGAPLKPELFYVRLAIMIKDLLQKAIIQALRELGIESVDFSLEHPGDLKNGDYSTNVAMVCAKKQNTNPRELAEKVVAILRKAQDEFPEIQEIQVAGAGFINFYLSRDFYTDTTKNILKLGSEWGSTDILSEKKVMIEYTQPNPFKPFHIGHLMSNAIGESLSRILESSGAKLIRANYQGDVGPHVAKAIWGLQQKGMPMEDMLVSEQAQYIGVCYSYGAQKYEEDENIKKEIEAINKSVYTRDNEEINRIYDWGRDVTLNAFELIYKTLGTKFDYYFFESEMAPIGERIVKENPKVFVESDGAVVFHGEEYDPKLHTRVFINSHGLPTYETKEIGLNVTKFEKENPDLSITTTAVEQADYMKVVRKAIEQVFPDIAKRMMHVTHGMMRLASGKMASRKGNVITGESLIQESMDVVREKLAEREYTDEEKDDIARIVGVSALKYSILHQALGGDIVYDFDKSISFEGDSGPYLQYSVTRAMSVLKKAEAEGICASYKDVMSEITALERELYKFTEIVERAGENYEPHHIVTYLTTLSSAFNSFYATYQVVNKNDPYSNYKVALTECFVLTMKKGLYLLGIETPNKM